MYCIVKIIAKYIIYVNPILYFLKYILYASNV